MSIAVLRIVVCWGNCFFEVLSMACLSKMTCAIVLAATFSIFEVSPVRADIGNPARVISEVEPSAHVEKTLSVPNARVVAANYTLLKRDFPVLRTLSNPEIDHWLLSNVAFISESQARQSIVNSPIQTSVAREKPAYRPRHYGRALVFEVDGGLIDGKGFGALFPTHQHHADGLATLGEVIREYLYQNLVQMVFDHSGTGLRTVGSYGVIDWGFDVIHQNGDRNRAGAILRQAHRRFPSQASLFPTELTLNIERVLRRYGITSAGAYRTNERSYDRMNIQGTADGAVIDFGAFLAVAQFDRPISTFLPSKLRIHQTDSQFVQPDPTIRVPLREWGVPEGHAQDPKNDTPWRYAHDLARAIADGRADRSAFDRQFVDMLGAYSAQLKVDHGGLCRSLFSPTKAF